SVRAIAPTKTRAWSRSERTVRDTRGMPLRISLKRRLPQRISRTIKRVHRPPNTSWARAMEQYCPYPVMPGNLSRRANRCGTESGPRLCPSTALADYPYGSGHVSGWIPSQEEFDRFDAACKESAGKVLDEARAMAEQIGISAELLHVPNAYPAAAIIETA